MGTSETLIDIKSLSTELLNPKIDSKEAERIINEIHTFYKDVTLISGYDSDMKHMVTLPATNGMALSINHAAQCLLDYKRTTKFLRGFVKAIKDKQAQYPGETIQVFYAGCGPYAPFVTLVAPLFSPKELQFSLLEINKDSIEKAESLIENLNLTAYIKACYLSDAITFKIPEPESYHILFSETLDALLYRECYVPILWNLLPQLSKNTSVVPENVKVNLYFKEGEKETFSSTLFDVRKVLEQQKQSQLPEQFKSVKVDLTKASKYDKIFLETEVYIYKDCKLERNESSLSLGLEMEIEKPIVHESVLFTYHTKPQVELKFTLK